MGKKRLPHVDLDSLDSDIRLWFLAIFNRDIREAQFFARTALEMADEGVDDQDPNSMYCCLHDAAIIRYARSFLACRLPDGTATTRLPNRYVFEGAPMGVLHERTMAARHGIVAHADMREREVAITKNHENVGEANRWTINTSGGNFPPQTLAFFVAMCEQHRKRIAAEIVPLIESRLSTMEVGETLTLASKDGGNVQWLDPEGRGRMCSPSRSPSR